MELFEKSSRLKLRFDTSRGQINTEDLWDLPLTSTVGAPNLDDIAKKVYKEIQDAGEIVSFVDDAKEKDPTNDLRLNIIKRVIEVKKAENKKARDAKERAEKKQELLAALKQKEGSELLELSADEIRKKIEELG